MAKASRKRMGVGAQGKGDGSGANTEISKDQVEENAVLSNRDKAQHSQERGLDSRQGSERAVSGSTRQPDGRRLTAGWQRFVEP